MEKSIRIAKRIAQSGLYSRRKAEEIIKKGFVKINGKIINYPSINVNENDIIEINGLIIPKIENKIYLMYKPIHCLTTSSDPKSIFFVFLERPIVFDYIDKSFPSHLMTIVLFL